MSVSDVIGKTLQATLPEWGPHAAFRDVKVDLNTELVADAFARVSREFWEVSRLCWQADALQRSSFLTASSLLTAIRRGMAQPADGAAAGTLHGEL